MELLQKHKEAIILLEALKDFFINFHIHRNIIDEMKAENGGFANEWEKLEYNAQEKAKKTGWMSTIEWGDFYQMFASKLTYKAQAMLVEKVMNHYGKKAAESIDFSIECDLKHEEHIKRTRKQAEELEKQNEQIIKNNPNQ